MRERLQEWAIYFGAVGLALWVAAGILFLLGNQPPERLITLLVIGLVAIVIYFFLRPQALRDIVASRGARYGSNSLLMVIAFIVIVGALNYLGTVVHYRQDVTANQQFTLSPLTTEVLHGLTEPVEAVAFYTATQQGQTNRQEMVDRLKEYATKSSKFTYRLVDPEAEPQIANDYKVQFDGTVVMQRGKRRENVLTNDEQGLTNAIIKVSQDKQPTIYFTTGHGEHGPADTGENGLNLMKGAMEQENYKVDVLDLTTITDTLPADTSALIIDGPRQPFQPAEVKIVQDYLSNNGRVMIMVDPQIQSGLDDLLKTYGLTLHNDAIFDPKQGFFGQAQVPVVNAYPNHAITQDLAGSSTFFPGTRSLAAVNPAPTGLTVTPLLTTSDAAWGETNFDSVKAQNAKYDEGADIKGPLSFAYAVEGTLANTAAQPATPSTNPARLVVIGNASFVTNGTLNARITVGGQQSRVQSGNGLLFGNSLHWLAGQENLIAIPAKQADSHPVFLTSEQSSFVFWSSFLLIPAVILILGILIWWRRR